MSDIEVREALAAATLAWPDLPALAGPRWPSVAAELAALLRLAGDAAGDQRADEVAAEVRLLLREVRAVARRLDAQPVPPRLLTEDTETLLRRLAGVAASRVGLPFPVGPATPERQIDAAPFLVCSAPDRVRVGAVFTLELRLAGRAGGTDLRVVATAPGLTPELADIRLRPGAAVGLPIVATAPGERVVELTAWSAGRLVGALAVPVVASPHPAGPDRVSAVAALAPTDARFGDLALLLRGRRCVLVDDRVETYDAPVPATSERPWEDLVPTALRAALLARLPVVRRLVVHTDGPTVPWEAMRPLTDRVAVCRWAGPYPPAQRLPDGPLVAPRTLDDLLAALAAGTAGAVRVEGAAGLVGGEPTVAVGGEPFAPSYLDGLDLGGVPVLLAPLGDGPAPPDVWAAALLAARAGTVVVPPRATTAGEAGAFRRALLAAMAAGAPLGAAAGAARRVAGVPYLVYGDPAATAQSAALSANRE